MVPGSALVPPPLEAIKAAFASDSPLPSVLEEDVFLVSVEPFFELSTE